MLNLGDIQQLITKILTLWFKQAASPRQSRLFKQVLYVLIGCTAISFLFDLSVFFGAQGIIYRRSFTAFTVRDVVYLLYYFPNYAAPVLVAIALLCAAGVAGKRSMISDALLLLLQVNFHNAVYPGLSGGHELLQQLLIFNCLISAKASSIQNTWLLFLHRFGVLCVQLQVCVVYLVAALSKFNDDVWLQGEAVFQVMQVQHFALYDSALFKSKGLLVVFLNYAVMVYQLGFPFLIWLQKWRKALIIVGTGIYLFIGLGMGVLFFAAVMLCAHLIFWPMKSN